MDKKKFCRQCGAQLKEDTIFCPKCKSMVVGDIASENMGKYDSDLPQISAKEKIKNAGKIIGVAVIAIIIVFSFYKYLTKSDLDIIIGKWEGGYFDEDDEYIEERYVFYPENITGEASGYFEYAKLDIVYYGTYELDEKEKQILITTYDENGNKKSTCYDYSLGEGMYDFDAYEIKHALVLTNIEDEDDWNYLSRARGEDGRISEKFDTSVLDGILTKDNNINQNDFIGDSDAGEREEIGVYTIVEDSVYDLEYYSFHNGVAWTALEDKNGNQFTALINDDFELLHKVNGHLDFTRPFDEKGYSYYYSKNDERYVIIDNNGTITWQGDKSIFALGEGLFAFKSSVDNGYNHSEPTYGIIDGDGNILLETTAGEFPLISAIDNGSWLDSVWGQYGLIGYRGKVYCVESNSIFELEGDLIGKNSNNNFVCAKEDYGQMIFTEQDINGAIVSQKELSLPDDDEYGMEWKCLEDDFIIRYNGATGEGKPLLLNSDISVKTDFSSLGEDIYIHYISEIENGMFSVLLKGVGGGINYGPEFNYAGIMDLNGNIILEPQKTKLRDAEFANGLLKIYIDEETRFYDIDGKCVFSVATDEVTGFSDGYAYIRGGYYDTSGKIYTKVTEKIQ